MSMRRANKRDANETPIVKALRQAGASVYAMHVPCDLLVGYRGVNYLVEVKATKGKHTAPQAEFIETWRGQYVTVRDPIEAVEWLNNIAQERAVA